MYVNIDDRLCCTPVIPVDDSLYKKRVSELSPVTFLNRDIWVIDTLTVDSSVTFLNCRFFMSAYAVVDVLPGVTLTLDTCAFVSACGDTLWRHILVRDSTATLNATNCRFTAAFVAIWSRLGGDVNLVSNRFTANREHVKLDHYTGTHGFYAWDNRFNGGTILFPPFAGQVPLIGIRCDTAGSVIVGDPAQLPNIFNGVQVGIYAGKTNLTCYNNEFRNIVQTPSIFFPTGQAIYVTGENDIAAVPITVTVGGSAPGMPNIFYRCWKGVYSAANTHLQLEGNLFRHVNFGIHSEHVYINTHILQNNTFTNCHTGIYTRDVTKYAFMLLQQNTFNNPADSARIGIRIDEVSMGSPTGNPRTIIQSNTLNSLYQGIWLTSAEDAYVFNNDIRIKPWTGGNQNYGIWLQNSQGNTVEYNTVAGTSSGLQVQVNGLGLHGSMNNLISCNNFRILGQCIEIWYNNLGTGIYGNSFRTAIDGMVWDNNGDVGTLGNVGNPTFKSDNVWNPKTSVLNNTNLISGNPSGGSIWIRSLATGSVYNPSISTAPLYPRGLATGTNYTCSPPPPAPADAAQLLTFRRIASDSILYGNDTADQRYNGKFMLGAWLQYDTVSAHTDSVLHTFCDTLADCNLGKLTKVQQHLSEGNLLSASSENSILPVTTQDFLLKTVTDIFLSMKQSRDTLTASQISALRDIAGRCPWKEGQAVTIARSILGKIDSTTYHYESDCEGESGVLQPQQTVPVESEHFLLFPNPASDYVLVEFNSTQVDALTLTSADGNTTWTIPLAEQMQYQEINISAHPAGVYVVRGYKNGIQVELQKLVIAK